MSKDQIKKEIKKYIDDNIKVSEKPHENIRLLSKITNYFFKLLKNVQDNISYELIDEVLLSNEVVNQLISSIVTKYLDYIQENSLEELLPDEITSQVVEIYCDKNDIDVNQLEVEEDTTQSLEDFVGDSQTMFLNETRRHRLLTQSETRSLIIKAHNGDIKSRDLLIEHNIRLIISIAKKFKIHGNNITMNDLIDEGVFGLIRAIEKFDIDKGYQFSTYATWWIKQSMRRFLNSSVSNIRYSDHIRENMKKIERVTKQIEGETGREPTIKELSEKTGFSETRIRNIKNTYCSEVSFDSPLTSEEPDSSLLDFVADENVNIEEDLVNTDFNNEIISALLNSRLTDRERKIIIHRFGLFGVRKKTLEEVGQMFNVTRERIRQQEAKALRILKADQAIKNLKQIDDGNAVNIELTDIYIINENYKLTHYFPGYTPSELRLGIKSLDKINQLLITKYYNEDFSRKKYTPMNNQDQHRLIRLIFRTLPATLKKVIVNPTGHSYNPDKEGIFYEIPNIPKHIITDVIHTYLPKEDKELLKKAFGPKFDENHYKDLILAERQVLDLSIIPYIRSEVLKAYSDKNKEIYTQKDIPILDVIALPSFAKLNPLIGPDLILFICVKLMNKEDLFEEKEPSMDIYHSNLTEEEKKLITKYQNEVADFIIDFQKLMPKIRVAKQKSIQ